MCGLVGAIGYIGANELKAFKNMLEVDVVRGPHSTGIVTVSPSGADAWAKAAMLPQDLFETRHFKAATAGLKVALMGHNRFATVGKIATATAHPFDFDNVIGMHNGTLRNWKNTLSNGHQFDVDSECLFAQINDKGLEDFNKIDGAFALTWYDKTDHSFNILRNDQRGLFTRMSKDGRTMFYASEAWMIEACCWRNSVQLNDTTYDVSVGKHFKWTLPKNGTEGLGKPTARKMKLYEPPVYPSLPNSGGASQGNSQGKAMSALPSPNCDFRKAVGKETDFYALEFKMTNRQMKYGFVEGVTTSEPNLTVHVYCHESEGKLLLEHDGICMARPSSFISEQLDRKGNVIKAGHLNVAFKEITLIDEVLPSLGPKGEPLTEKEFNELTKHGCSQCSCDLLWGEEIDWWNNEPFCDECYEEFKAPKVVRIH